VSEEEGYEEQELEDIKRRRMVEIQRRLLEEQRRTQVERQQEQQKQVVLRQILSPAARQRLSNLRIVRPEFVEQLELELIQAVQTGKIQVPITDEQLRALLGKLQVQKREIQFRRV